MAISTNKKVIVVRFDREALTGFVQPATYLAAESVELLSQTGNVLAVPYGDVKAVCFVRDWNDTDRLLEKRTFASRPKQEGLWVKLLWKDGDWIEALLANRLLDLEPTGFSVVPPDPSANAQKIFVPRAALREVSVLGVVGSPLRQQSRSKKPTSQDQLKMFD